MGSLRGWKNCLLEADRNEGRPSTELLFRRQGGEHVTQNQASAFRWQTGLNRAEWERHFEKAMILRCPAPSHPTTFVPKEDGSGDFEKVWLYHWAPFSGFRTVERRFGSAFSCKTTLVHPSDHLYDSQVQDSVAQSFQQHIGQIGSFNQDLNCLPSLHSETSNLTLRNVHPLGYEDDTPPPEHGLPAGLPNLPRLNLSACQQASGASIGMPASESLFGSALHHVPGSAEDVIIDAQEPVPTTSRFLPTTEPPT